MRDLRVCRKRLALAILWVSVSISCRPGDDLNVFGTLVGPAEGSTLTQPRDLSFEVMVHHTFTNYVASVAFYDNAQRSGTPICTVSTAPFECSRLFTGDENGAHSWAATITATSGHVGRSNTLSFNVDIGGPSGESRNLPTSGLLGFVPATGVARGVAMTGGATLVASENFGVTVADLDAQQAVEAVRTPFIGEHIATDGARAIVTGTATDGTARMWVVDDPVGEWPHVVGELATDITPGSTAGFSDVAFSAARGLAILAAGTDGVWVVDVSTPEEPTVVGTWATSSWAMGVALNDAADHVYVANGGDGFAVLDIGQPASPVTVGSRALGGSQHDVVVEGQIAYLMSVQGNLRSVDVSHPASPSWLGGGALSGVGVQIAVEGTTLVATTSAPPNGHIDRFDVSNPALLQRTGTAVVGTHRDVHGVDLRDGEAHVAVGALGIKAFDVNGSTPTLVAAVHDEFAGGLVAAVADVAVVAGEHLPSNTAFARIVDVTVPTEPRIVAELETDIAPGSVTGFKDLALSPDGTLLVAALGADGILLVDLSSPSSPQVVGEYDSPSSVAWAFGVWLEGTLAFVADGADGMKILDISNPAAPTLVGTHNPSNTQKAVAVLGTTSYLLSQSAGLRMQDVSDPAAPRWIGSRTVYGFGHGLTVQGTTLAVVSTEQSQAKLVLFDVTDPASPTYASTTVTGTLQGGTDVALAGSTAFVVHGDPWLHSYDISNLSNPLLVDEHQIPGHAHDVATLDGRAIIADSIATLAIVQP